MSNLLTVTFIIYFFLFILFVIYDCMNPRVALKRNVVEMAVNYSSI